MTRKVYIASSWKNVLGVRLLARMLRERGHKVFDFTDPNERPDNLNTFVFQASEWLGKALTEIDWLEFMDSPATRKAFTNDRAGLDWADTIVLINPSGRSSHLEAGYGVGRGKRLFIYGDLPNGEFDTMYFFADGRFRQKEWRELCAAIDDSQNGVFREKPGEGSR